MSPQLVARTLEPDHIYFQGGTAGTPATTKAEDSVVVSAPVGASIQGNQGTGTARYWQISMDLVRRTIEVCK